ncbi:hypothetical protein OESDEN_09747 [Oesophagostomum dentatum]|uniref:Uncharacterized protein n=1 Tax=Oesophagostomum dentatum TaxID=61180 RepID=A0A0B1SZI7_OESDE|nr:hypothetical protein OESDEN_09747 [Oesophagostomum dentatum]
MVKPDVVETSLLGFTWLIIGAICSTVLIAIFLTAFTVFRRRI